MDKINTNAKNKKLKKIELNIDELLLNFKHHEKDVGSSEVQIIGLTARISNLSKLLMQARKDFCIARTIPRLVAQRKRLFAYLKRNDKEAHIKLAQSLNLKIK